MFYPCTNMKFLIQLSIIVGVCMMASSLRVVRSANALQSLMGAGVGMQCSINCGITHAQSWQRILGVTNESGSTIAKGNKLSIDLLLGRTINMTQMQRRVIFQQVCEVYTSFESCLDLCPDDVIKRGISSGISSLKLLCGPRKEDFIAVLPCLSSKDSEIKNLCEAKNDRLTVSSMQLQNVAFARIDLESVMQALKIFCRASADQSSCVLPAVADACGVRASDLMQDILAESLTSTNNLLKMAGLTLPAECQVPPASFPTAMPLNTQIPPPFVANVQPEVSTSRDIIRDIIRENVRSGEEFVIAVPPLENDQVFQEDYFGMTLLQYKSSAPSTNSLCSIFVLLFGCLLVSINF